MKMIAAVLVLLIVCTSIHAGPKEDKKTNADHIKSYFEEIGTRDATLNKLRYEDREELSKLVVGYLKNDDTFDDALKLAIKLRIPNLYKVLEKKMEDAQSEIVEWCFVAQDHDAIEDLYKLMLKEDGLRADVVAGFMSYPTTIKMLGTMEKLAGKKNTDPNLRNDLLKIIGYQTGREFSNVDELSDAWKEIEKEWKTFGYEFKYDGLDIIKYAHPELTNVSSYGPNYKLESGSSINLKLIGEKYYKKSFKIKFWIYTSNDSNANMGMKFKNGTWTASTQSKEHWVLGGVNANQAPRVDGEWKEVSMEIDDSSGDGEPNQLMHLRIAGHDLLPSGGISKGGLVEMQISCTDGTVYVGGLQIVE